MSRPLRIEYAGALYHVTARGNARGDIYFSDEDRRAWLDVFGSVCERFNWRCHSWCQMTNHYHVLVETIEGNLSAGMRELGGVYTQYVNRTHRRVGHLFQGRYKAVLVEKEVHLLELARYVVLNPVRARMVADAGDWRWSAYGALVGVEPAPQWLETDWLLAQFGSDQPAAVRAFVDFVRAGVGLPSVWDGLRNQIYLGSEAFVHGLQKHHAGAAAQLREVPRLQRRPPALPLAHYLERFKTDAKAGMRAAYATGDYTLQEVADAFGVHYATVSRAMRVRNPRESGGASGGG